MAVNKINTINQSSRLDVGVIGYWFATNYGGVASYYSLYKSIEELGYKPFLVENPYFDTDKEGEDVFSRNFFKNEGVKIAEHYNNANLNQLNKLTDTFLLGSDQVLTTSSLRGFGKLFLMEFAENSKKRIAYSSSCGGDNLDLDNNVLAHIKTQLKKFSSISVREYSAEKILKDKFDIKSNVVVDPIFFSDAKDYVALSQKVSKVVDGNYMLSYVLDPNEDKKKCISEISKQLSIDSKIALDGRKFTYETNYKKINLPKNVLPELDFYQWLNCFVNASFIFTDSFHGAVMSLILNKPCIIYINRGRGYPRFETLGKMFDISNRMINNSAELNKDKIVASIDFTEINKKITAEINNGKKWLENALSEKFVPKNVANDNVPALYNDPDFIKIRLLGTLLRDYGVKHVVLSPGGRDVPIIRMFENNDDQFVLHRVTDERSAAYYGMGIASRLRQPVACVCTSGTAASNYLPAVTEAYYTNIPLIMITADRRDIFLNQGEDQTIPQKTIYHDVVKKEITIPEGSGRLAELQARRDISDCILETTHHVFGPVHINLSIDNIGVGAKEPRESWKLLPFIYPHILRVDCGNGMEEMHKWVDSLKKSQRILVVYGQNAPASEQQLKHIESFASKYNCVIVADPISNFSGAYTLQPYNMLNAISQNQFNEELSPDILISVGGKRLMNDPLTYKIRGGYGNIRHWSVSPDGKIKDFYFRLSSVLEMSQDFFFEWFAKNAGDILNNGVYYGKWKSLNDKYDSPTISNFNANYIQSKFLPAIPKNSFLHLGVGQSFFDCRRYHIDKSVDVYCNMGTNGIDGCTSTFMGQCSVIGNKLCFLLIGDLSFFYDMNAIWNKQLGNSVRILLVNNNGSGLLRGHNLKAVTSVHNTSAEGWVRSTGFEYLSARSKEEFEANLSYFISDKPQNPVFFEVFCD